MMHVFPLKMKSNLSMFYNEFGLVHVHYLFRTGSETLETVAGNFAFAWFSQQSSVAAEDDDARK